MQLRRKHEILKSAKDFKSIFPRENGNFYSQISLKHNHEPEAISPEHMKESPSRRERKDLLESQNSPSRSMFRKEIAKPAVIS